MSSTVQLVIGDKAAPSPADVTLRDHIRGLGHDVTLRSDEDPEDTAAVDLVIIFESSVGSTLGSKYGLSSAVPVLSGEHVGWVAQGLSSGLESHADRRAVEIVDPSDPIAAGYAGEVDLFSATDPGWDISAAQSTTLGDGVVKVGRMLGMPDWWAIFRYDTGAAMYRDRAPARRVAYDLSDEAISGYTRAAWDIFDASVAWLLDDAAETH